MPMAKVSSRFFTSPGLTPDMAMRMRSSPGPGSGSGISPTVRTSRAGPCFSYQAAFMGSMIPPFDADWLTVYWFGLLLVRFGGGVGAIAVTRPGTAPSMPRRDEVPGGDGEVITGLRTLPQLKFTLETSPGVS